MIEGAIIGGIIGAVCSLIIIIVMKRKGGDVPRFSHFQPFTGDINQILMGIDGILKEKGYKPTTYKNDTCVYRCGSGFWTAPKYIKVMAVDGGIVVEGFIVMYGSETGLDGNLGAIPKKSCKKVIEQIINYINSPQPQALPPQA